MSTFFVNPPENLPSIPGTPFAEFAFVKAILASTVLMILLLVGARSLPPVDLSDVTEVLTDACAPLLPGQRGSNERCAGTALKTLSSAQADFRANDRDGDGVNQFWRADVAGLYALAPGGGPAIKLILLSVAAADARPLITLPTFVPRRTSSGYWIRAIRHADENPKALNPNRFAFCAFPQRPSAGKRILIIDENNSIFSCVVESPGGIEVFPTDDELRAKWSRWG